MEKERRVKVLIVVALIVAVLGLTVAFGVLSQKLTIRGTANVETGTWDIYFEGYKGGKTITPTTTGGAKANEITLADKSTTISGIEVTLTKPGDEAKYEFDAVNAGTIDAKISTLTENKGICASVSGTKTDQDLVCTNLVYSFTYDNDVKIIPNHTMLKGERKHLKLIIGYSQDADKLPSEKVTINIPDITITYVQK